LSSSSIVKLAALASFAWICACGGDAASDVAAQTDTGTGADGALVGDLAPVDAPPAGPPSGAILVADADRDGVVDPLSEADRTKKHLQTAEWGASFLANLDDDDGDQLEDANDLMINGDEDAKDLARVLVTAWQAAPDGTTAKLSVGPLEAQNVRIWRHLPDTTWVLVLGNAEFCKTSATCAVKTTAGLSTADLREGVELGVEGRKFRMSTAPSAWDGVVHLAMDVTDATGALLPSPALPSGHDEAALRVAPWMQFGNLDAFDEVRSAAYFPVFVSGTKKALESTSIDYPTYSDWNDQWTQDIYQTGWTSIPGPKGTVQAMRVLMARPWGREDGAKWLPITFLRTHYLGPNRGIVAAYKGAPSGSTFDSFGNCDHIPSYAKSHEDYPFGRILHGSNVLPETAEFYKAQRVQGPPVVINTAWLAVGHIDETTSWVPAKTPRGWKLLLASDDLGKSMLEEQSKKGNGKVQFFIGLKNYDPKTDKLKTATVTIDEALADVDLMQWSQEAEVETTAQRAALVQELGLGDDEIVDLPLLTEDVGGKIAWLPGMVNALVYSDHILMADPFGPKIDGADLFKTYVNAELGTAKHGLGAAGKGLAVHFVDDWSSYHVNMGEVHCATNPEGPAPVLPWWTLGI